MPLKVGDRLMAHWDDNFTDNVTENKIYKVVEVNELGRFFVINDKDEKCMPISTSFTKVN